MKIFIILSNTLRDFIHIVGILLIASCFLISCSPSSNKWMKKTVEKSGRGCIASIRMVDIYYNKDGSIDSNSDTNGYCLYTFDYKNNIITGTMVSDTSSEVVEFHKFGRFGKEEFYLNLYGNIIHLKYHFNKQGLLTKETSIDTTASNYKETNYFYDNRKRLIKKVTHNKDRITQDSSQIQYISGKDITLTMKYRMFKGNKFVTKTISNAKSGIDTIYSNSIYANKMTIIKKNKKNHKRYEDVYSNGKLVSSSTSIFNRQNDIMIKETTFPDREKQIERFEYIKDNVGNVIQNDIYIDGRLSAQFFYTFTYCN